MIHNSHRVTCIFAITFASSVVNASAQTLPSSVDLSETNRIELRHKANFDFYRRVLSFSQLSWASPFFLDQGSEKGWYILSADVSPHFNIGGERLPMVFQLTPRYMVRIFRNSKKFNDSSLPVRTPSYIPGATLYVPLSKKKQEGNDYDWYRNINYFSGAFFHHSNGQDGPEVLEDGSINVRNGNFSTNFIEANFHFNKRRKKTSTSFPSCNGDADCSKNEMPYGYRDLYGKLGLQQHFNTTDPIRRMYGTTRINLNVGLVRTYNTRLIIYRNNQDKLKSGSQVDTQQGQQLDLVGKLLHKNDSSLTCEVVGKCYQKEYIRFTLNTSFAVNRLSANNDLSKKINADLGMYVRISGNNTAWFITAGYYGSDPYNIYFLKSYGFIRTGIALGFFNYTNKFQYE